MSNKNKTGGLEGHSQAIEYLAYIIIYATGVLSPFIISYLISSH